MKIDWKQLAKSKGYMSLKAEYINSAMRAGKEKHPMRGKEELYKNFQWVICRAKHYAKHLNRSIESILNEWEEKRTYGALNYYQDCRQPRFHSGHKKPMGIKGISNYYKKSRFYDAVRKKRRVMEFIQFEQKKSANKERKPRWSNRRKSRGY